MSCIPNNKDFTPCQLGAMARMTKEQQRAFATQVGLLERLEELQKLANQPNNPSAMQPSVAGQTEFNPAYSIPVGQLGSRFNKTAN